ncbi:ead/Ea22-like family protein [Klebsiella michiganensis]|uniref:ead/Ea22-like family protein n=1 Tax=Klebsiella michiganensis TaxID=1134687 RepID=UPI003B269EDA
MTDITELAQSLKAAAEKATPGEWVYFPKNTSIEYDVGSDESQGSILYVDSGDFTQAQTDRNGEFIALANPANVKRLVEALEKAQAQSSKWLEAYHKAVSIGARYEERIAELEEAEQKLCAANVTLDARAELAERRLAEMEFRTVTVRLPKKFKTSMYGTSLYEDLDILKMLTDAGIKWEAE